MPGIRKPLNVLTISGAVRKNPQRYRQRENTPADKRPIGRVPATLNDDEKTAWRDIVASDPGVLRASDRATVEMAARLMAEVRNGENVPTSRLALLQTILHRLGQTPIGRNYVSVPTPRAPNRFDED